MDWIPDAFRTAFENVKWQAAPPLWVIALVILPALLGVVFFVYRRENAPGQARFLMATIRFVVLAVLIAILFLPTLHIPASELLHSHVIVLVDSSLSMKLNVDDYSPEHYGPRAALRLARFLGTLAAEPPAGALASDATAASYIRQLARGIRDDKGKATRADVREALRPYQERSTLVNTIIRPAADRQSKAINLLAELRKRHRVLLYSFDSRVRPDPKPGKITPDEKGVESRLGDALEEVLKASSRKLVAGVVILSDGQANSDRTPPLAAARMAASSKIPIFTVGIGNPNPPSEIELIRVVAPDKVLAGNPVPFTVYLRNKGFEGYPVKIHVLHENKDLTSPRKIALARPNRVQEVQISHTFKRPGKYVLTVRLEKAGHEAPGRIENNGVVHRLEVIDKRIRVLYVDWQPRWEYRYLKNALIREPAQIVANTWLISADPGYPQERTRPLAPGLREIPRTWEALRDRFDVVILGNIKRREFPGDDRNFLTILRRFVLDPESSGGLIVSAGPHHMPESYSGTPLDDVLPVQVEDAPEPETWPVQWRLRLTAEGARHPICALEPEPAANRRIWDDAAGGLEGFFWHKLVSNLKPGAVTLAIHPTREITIDAERNERAPMPLIAVQEFPGAGRTLFVGVDSTWRWRKERGDRYFKRFWKQAVFWAGNNSLLKTATRYEILTDRTVYAVGEEVETTANVFGRDTRVTDKPTQKVYYTVTHRDPSGKEVSSPAALLELPAISGSSGIFSKKITATRPGLYKLWIKEKDEGDEVPVVKATWSFRVYNLTAETEKPQMNKEALAAIAAETRIWGGRYFDVHELAGLGPLIRPRVKDRPQKGRLEDVWHMKTIFAGLIALLALEWAYRKSRRLL